MVAPGLFDRSVTDISSVLSKTMAGGSADLDGLRPVNNVGDRGPLPDDESLIAVESLSLAELVSLADPATLAFDFRRLEEPDAPRIWRVVLLGDAELARG
jgi:hypothetical protein